MPARLMKASPKVSPLPQSTGSRAHAANRARDAFFTSLSRELRLSLNGEGYLMLVDGAWHSVLGWEPEQLHGWHWEELVHPADHARVNECLRRLRSGQGCERDVDLRLAMRAGGHHRTRWTLVSGSGADSILGLGHDQVDAPAAPQPSSELAERNGELAASLRELEERYAAVERFAATAAHQLAEPLVIAECSAILVAEELGEDLDPMLRGRLHAIGRGAARARRLMDALLADARTGSHEPARRPVNLASVVDNTLVSLDLQTQERTASFVVGPLPHVLGDPGLVSVVLDNLASNALKYGPRSGACVEITAERRSEHWRISVASGGTPIPAEEAERIFQPFHRVPGERRVPGIGLGLTVCARLMERMDGTIGVEPGADSGNTFWISLPAADEARA